MKKRVAFYTLGCKVNQYETNAMIQKFINSGYKVVDIEENADIYVVNTCTVTNMSDRKSRQVLRRFKEKNPDSVVVAVGCYVQVAKDEVEKIDEIDICLGNLEKNDIVSYVEDYINTSMQKDRVEVVDVMNQKEYCDFGSVTYTDKTRAVVKIQDGCDRFCSYCIIPYARGRVRSRSIESIVEEIKQIVDKGIKEVVITGIHIASYGRDFKNGIELIDLLEKINEIDKLERIRLGSIEPLLITEKFINRLLKLEKICHHFHLSLQSGCDDTLKRMNRIYTTEEFRNIVDILRKNYDDVILTTDIIVGFPGETEEEFNKTYEFLKEIKFYKMHVFKYSPRKGTKAAQMKCQIDGNEKERRSKILIELSEENQKRYNQKYIDSEIEVLFEERDEKDNKYIKGHSKNYIMVYCETSENVENKTAMVHITGVRDDYLLGKIV